MKNPIVINCEQILVQKWIKDANGNEKLVDYSDEKYCEDIKCLTKEFVDKYRKQDPNLISLLETLLDHFVFAFKGQKGLHELRKGILVHENQNETHKCTDGGNNKGNIESIVKV